MDTFPHHYSATVVGATSGTVATSSPGLPELAVDSPPEFGGPGGSWSPETLLMAAVADCFVLSWRSIAAASSFGWTALTVEAAGVLDRIDRVTRFTQVHLTVQLTVPQGSDRAKAERLVHKSETACLITNSMNAETTLEFQLTEG